MSRWLYPIGFGSCAAVFYLFIIGCTMSEGHMDPNALFHNTLQQLSVEAHVVQWEDIESVINQRSMNLNWNPLQDTERYQKGATTITLDQERSNPQTVVLSAKLDNLTAKEVLLDQLHDQMDEIRTEAPYTQNSAEQSLSVADKARMSNEIQTYIDQADRQLLERLNSSEVHSTMLLWINRATEKPIRVQFHTTIDYIKEGQTSKETLMDSYLIS
ncbi:MAG: hypothetical protein WDZ91_11505 [Paenibacillaceae bacterium]